MKMKMQPRRNPIQSLYAKRCRARRAEWFRLACLAAELAAFWLVVATLGGGLVWYCLELLRG